MNPGQGPVTYITLPAHIPCTLFYKAKEKSGALLFSSCFI